MTSEPKKPSTRRAKPPVGELLMKLWPKVLARKARLTIPHLRRMCASSSAKRRLTALLAMRRQIGRGRRSTEYMRLARRMIDDSDNDCRWQALIVTGEFIETHPDDIWQVVEQYGQHEDEDMRAGVATVLLEDLLEHHRRRFGRRSNRLASVSPRFAETLNMCWRFD